MTSGPDPSSGPSPSPGPVWTAALRTRLLEWFRREARPLPWRKTTDPYAIWVSEIMLQQTRVETVIPYWERWMASWPTAEALAEADEAEVLKGWEGLGYYSRARNLHQAARRVREEWGGKVPGDLASLRSLPGVGPYTAGAVASIAFGIGAPAVDGNVRRVVSRLLDWPDPTLRQLERVVERWVPGDVPGDFNQAVMELGATVCTPRSPACVDCPVADLCGALVAGTVAERPVRKRKAAVPREEEMVAVVLARGSAFRVLVRRRPATGLLAGMFEFPGARVGPGGPGSALEELIRELGVRVAEADVPGDPVLGGGLPLPPVAHTFSHLHLTYRPILLRLAGEMPEPAPSPPGHGETAWLTPVELEALPLPVAQQSIVESLRAAVPAAWAEE